MKILIAYASAGAGHRRAAEALYNYIKDNYTQTEVKITDVLEYTNCIFRNLYNRGYAFLITKLPLIWSLVYRITYSRTLGRLNKNLRYVINRLNTRGYEKFLLRFKPTIIISTHFLPSEVTSYLKREKNLNSYLVTVITDFSVHPFWISDGSNEYMVASEFTKHELVARGIAEDRIRVSGIPVDSKFTRTYDRGFLCKRLDIQPGLFTLMLETAGFGLGPFEEIIDLLHQDLQLLVVCGRNRRLFNRLETRSYRNVKIFGFIDNIEELMAVSDMIITKPGGLTISESLAMSLPMIFITAIFGQETKNARILESYAIGTSPADTKSLRDKVYYYKDNPTQLMSIKEDIGRIRKPFAAREICDAICKGSPGIAC